MATSTTTKAAKATKATTANTPQPHTSGPYRSNAAWATAHGAAMGAKAGNPAYAAAVQVATHLAWRGPAATVAWHKGTNANMLANAQHMGVTTGMAVQAAMATVVAAMQAAANTPAQHSAANTMAALVGPTA